MSQNFDYVVVGGGPAGCAVAARLAESDSTLRVALIERGPPQGGLLSDIPLGLAAIINRRNTINYAYETVPQPALNNRRGFHPRGRGLGGSSLINAMIYIRGQAEDYQSWEDQAGCKGWGWNDVLPFFKRAENNERGADDYHGTGGPLNVADLRSPNPIAEAFVQAAIQAGFPHNPDFNGATQEGVGPFQVSQKNGARFPAAHGYIRDRAHKNLAVITNAQVNKIIFQGQTATGVEITQSGQTSIITANAEIIISCGAFGSPQLLMCSGIGPAEHLRQHGITVVHNSPDVGSNLQDHIDYTISRKLNHPMLVGFAPSAGPQIWRAWRTYKKQGTGLLTSNAAETGAFLKSTPDLARPDIQLHFVIAIVDDHGRKIHLTRGHSIHTCVLRPKSRGTVRLASAKMADAPLIDPKFLSHPDDMQTLKRGVGLALRILQAPAMRPYLGKPLRPPTETLDETLDARIRASADTIYHPVGTCRMGADPAAVLDPTLRVRGTENLRVVDASIMPTLISGNTAAPSAMIGERAAALIRQGA